MSAQKIRGIIAAAVAVVVLGTILILYLYTTTLKPYEPLTSYDTRYSTSIHNINAGASVYRERDYYVATTDIFETPANGELIVNPIQLPDDEGTVPAVQQTTHIIENTIQGTIYTRITNSKRTEERSGTVPEAALFSLEFQNTLRSGTWQSLTMYNNNSKEELVDSALLFAASNSSSATNWEQASSLYLIDGALTNHAAALLPGVNILNESTEDGRATGVLYTNRSLSIGGAPTALQDADALEALKQTVKQEKLADAKVLSLDISQRITGTDLVFTAPEGGKTLSRLTAPYSQSGLGNSLTVEGGVISVGEGATLVVGSGEIGDTNPLIESFGQTTHAIGLGATHTGGTIELSPRSIIVDGGTLILSNTEARAITLNTSIQVRNGGTLKVGNNIIINGNIYVFGGSTLEILGSFVLNGTPVSLVSPQALEAGGTQLSLDLKESSKRVPGGIFIFANNTLLADGRPLGSGYLEARILWLIDGSDGIDPLIHSQSIHFLTTEGAPGYPFMYNEYCCEGAKNSSYICSHFGSVEGVIAPTIKVGLSQDMAVVDAFAVEG